MATKKKETVFLMPVRGKEDPNFYVGINGKAYIIPRGEAVEVPPEVAHEIRRSQEAEKRMNDKKDELIQLANKPLPKR